MAVNNNELLPCPFCGGKAKWKGYYTGSTAGLVECTGCAACTRGGNWKEAKEHWNARWDYYGDTIECYECAIGGKEAAQRSVEENIRAQGYVKERTCRNVSEWHEVDEFVCSECGIKLTDWVEVIEDEEQAFRFEYAFKYCPSCGARVVSEEEQGHMVADAIRRLEKAVEG